jgi:hypothetical protein
MLLTVAMGKLLAAAGAKAVKEIGIVAKDLKKAQESYNATVKRVADAAEGKKRNTNKFSKIVASSNDCICQNVQHPTDSLQIGIAYEIRYAV